MALTFLEAWRLRGGVQPDGGSLRPWLLGIATNTARNAQRARRRYEAALGRLPPPDVVPDFAQEPAGRIDDARTLEAVAAAVSTLRQAEREVVALCVWAGLDYAAAAEALGIPVGTVRSRLARARKKLTKAAQDHSQDHSRPDAEPDRHQRVALRQGDPGVHRRADDLAQGRLPRPRRDRRRRSLRAGPGWIGLSERAASLARHDRV
jgi:RNA polymerase sigma-70 factor (ECF subfamily)